MRELNYEIGVLLRHQSPTSYLSSPQHIVETARLTPKRVFPQTQMARLQKEREGASAEVDALNEKVDLLQTQLGKAQRDRENTYGDLELLKEKYEKTSTQLQKLMVGAAS